MKGRLRIIKKNEKRLGAVIGSPAAGPRSLPLVQQRVPPEYSDNWSISLGR
jgi:hypothetical protein